MLSTLSGLLRRMFDVVDEQFADAVNALREGDVELARKARRRDDEIDDLEIEIDREGERLLSEYSPNGKALRMILAAMKINTDLERIGDHVRSIAKHALKMAPHPNSTSEAHLDDMIDHVRSTMYAVSDALEGGDSTLARQVLDQQRVVHTLHRETLHTAVTELTDENDAFEVIYHLTGVSKALERVSDHCDNIAESVVFWLDGEDLRHRRKEKQHKANNTASTS